MMDGLVLMLLMVLKVVLVLLLRMVVPIIFLMLLEMVMVVVTEVLVLGSEHAVVVRLEKEERDTFLLWKSFLWVMSSLPKPS